MKLLPILLVAVALLAATHVAAGEIEDACKNLVLDYAVFRDRQDAASYANLFAEDAELSVLDDRFVGRTAIHQRLIESRGKETTRHLMSTIRISVEDEDNATGISYVRIYASPAGELPMAAAQKVVGEYHDRFERTADGWKISRREFVPVFMPE
jgi:ketosteroid isomerase-like protein